jgi:O-antigen ligase
VLACAVLAAALPWTTMPLIPDEGVFRFRWFAVHPLDAATQAGAAAIGLLGVIVFARTREIPAKPGLGMRLLFLLLVTLLVITSSRGPMLALAAGIAVLWLIRARPPFRAAAALVACASALICVVYVSELRSWADGIASRDSVVSRVFFRNQTVDDVFELNGRLELWEELGPMVRDHYVFGVGYQASRAALLDVAEWAAYAHNALLQTILDLGLAGTLAMVGLLALGLRAGFRPSNARWVRATVPALIVFLTLNSMSNESFAAAPDIELLLVFMCALCGGPWPPPRMKPEGEAPVLP